MSCSFLAGDETFRPESKQKLDDYVRFFKGKSRIICGLDEIKTARAASASARGRGLCLRFC